MSPENQGVFQLLKEVTFRRILTFYNSRKWCHFWGGLSTVLVACITVTGSVIIIVVKHSIETHYLSLEEMGKGHA